MKKATILFLFILFWTIVSGCAREEISAETVTAVTETQAPATESEPETVPTEAETTAPAREAAPTEMLGPVPEFTEEEKQMLLKIGMAELGSEGCPECIALVMCTICNRVESGRFGKSIRSVLFAQDQFTPVMDGSYYRAEPNETCYQALEMVLSGWDESQGALYYEFCEGESWHSRNLQLLFQHCNTRFYTN